MQTSDSFVERIELGYYHYEQRTEWRTCAVAAMTAATHGREFVERTNYNFEEAQYMLSAWIGTDLNLIWVTVEGRQVPILNAIMNMNDSGWKRDSIAKWLDNLV